MSDLLSQYKGDLSNFDCLKTELENLSDELDEMNRTKVTKQFAEEVLQQIKKIRLLIFDQNI